MNKKILFLLFLIFIAVLFIFIHASKYSPNDSLNLYISSDPSTFNPITANDATSAYISSFIFEGLTELDPETLEIKPKLAHKWQFDKENNIWTFYLKDNIFWSDGEQFTSRDVVFTYNDLIYNPDIPNSAKDVLSVDGKKFKIKAIDKFTVEFELPDLFAPFLLNLSQPILPYHKLNSFVKSKKFLFVWGIDTNPKDIVGTGPYKIEKYLFGQRILLKKNNFRQAHIENISISIIPYKETALLKFLRGQLDIIPISGEDFGYIKEHKNLDKKFNIYDIGPELGSQFIVFNQSNKHSNKLFLDENFRKAVSYAIDRGAIIDNIYYGMAIPQYGPLTNADALFFNPQISAYEYDPKKALKLIKKTGFKNIEFNLLTASESPERIAMCNIIKDDLKKIGIKVNVIALQFNLLVNKITSTYDWDCILIGLTGGIDPHFGKNVWAKNGQLHMWNRDAKENYTKWEQEIDDIFNKAVKEMDIAKRKKLYDRWQKIASEKLPLIHLAVPTRKYGVSVRIKNVRPTIYGGVLHNIEELSLK